MSNPGQVILKTKDLPNNLNFIEWMSINHTNNPRIIPRIVVVANTLYIEPQHLEDRIISAIKEKEGKKYRETIGQQELWLLVSLRDGITSKTDFDLLNVTYKSPVFN